MSIPNFHFFMNLFSVISILKTHNNAIIMKVFPKNLLESSEKSFDNLSAACYTFYGTVPIYWHE